MVNADYLSEEAFLNSIDFNSGVINSIPGFFYLYEVVGNELFLRKWNKAHIKILGYTDNELYNKKASVFFHGGDYPKVKAAVQDVITKGEGQVEARARTKDGRFIPCIFTGYFIRNQGKSYLLGQGIVITYQKQIEQELEVSRTGEKKKEAEKKKLAAELAEKKRELVSTALEMSSTAGVIQSVLKTIEDVLPNHTGCHNVEDLFIIKKKLEFYLVKQDNWHVFRERFKEVHPYFFEKLRKAHPALTKSELKFAAYLRIRLSTTQIMTALNVSKEAIKKKRHRIRKKLGLLPKESLEDYFARF